MKADLQILPQCYSSDMVYAVLANGSQITQDILGQSYLVQAHADLENNNEKRTIKFFKHIQNT
jgi:hypothetical protein